MPRMRTQFPVCEGPEPQSRPPRSRLRPEPQERVRSERFGIVTRVGCGSVEPKGRMACDTWLSVGGLGLDELPIVFRFLHLDSDKYLSYVALDFSGSAFVATCSNAL